MCKRQVYDKETFIRAAIARHGDRYDYTDSVYIKGAASITIVCKDHGPFTIQTQGHHAKGIGCPKCKIMENRAKTGLDKRLEQKEKARQQRKKRKEWLASRKCVVCGNSIASTDSRQFCCSTQCAHRKRLKERVVLVCCVCGNLCTKPAYNIKKGRSVACSDKCQKSLAARAQNVQRANAKNWADYWKAKSRKAKKKWQATRRKERRDDWIKLCDSFAHTINRRQNREVDAWKQRVQSAVNCMIKRQYEILQNTSAKRLIEPQTWDDAIQKQKYRVRAKRKQKQDAWYRKMHDTYTSIRRRKKYRTGRNETNAKQVTRNFGTAG